MSYNNVLSKYFQYNKALQSLNLSNTDLKTSSIIALSIVATHHPTLVILNLARPLLHAGCDETVVQLHDMIKQNKFIRELDLSSHQIRDDGIDLLCKALRYNSSIQKLNLACNQITIPGGEHLGEFLKDNKTILELDLSANRIDSMGGAAVAKCLTLNKTLRSLDVSSNNMNDATLCEFAYMLMENLQITSVRVLNNKFDQKSIAAFAELIQKRPELDIDIVPYKTDSTYYVAVKHSNPIANPLLNLNAANEEALLDTIDEYNELNTPQLLHYDIGLSDSVVTFTPDEVPPVPEPAVSTQAAQEGSQAENSSVAQAHTDSMSMVSSQHTERDVSDVYDEQLKIVIQEAQQTNNF